MSVLEPPARLRGMDYAILVGFCLVLFSFPLLNNRVLTTHETVHCQNIREMRSDGDWIIPHYGGRPWLERPPLPFWFTVGLVEVLGDAVWVYRLASLLAGLPCVLLVGWMASVWYGRGIGVASGLILATMQEFHHYATGPEADIFLCLVVTTALALFVRLEFCLRPVPTPALPSWPRGREEDVRFLGRRPWTLLAFFAVLGLANLVKGLFFGMLFILLPSAAFLLWNADLKAIRRYFWLPGWLAFLLTASFWAIAAYGRYPDIVDLWLSDYVGRLNQGYMREPFWYYLVHLPWVIFPWTAAALYGLWRTRRLALGQRMAPERFLWCWALVPVIFFSIPQGKHHHYLLQCMAPWAILGALGAAQLWQGAARLTGVWRTPWKVALALGLPGGVALALLGARLPGSGWLVPILLIGWPLCVYVGWWAVLHKDARVALGTFCMLFLGMHWLTYGYRTLYFDRYRDDTAFVREACSLTPADRPILVMDDDAPLNASWLLFYVGERATLLHNLTFLMEAKPPDREVYLIARRKTARALRSYGTSEILAESKQSRYQKTPEDRYALFRVRLRDDLDRQAGGVRISPMQATGRAAGPFLPVKVVAH